MGIGEKAKKEITKEEMMTMIYNLPSKGIIKTDDSLNPFYYSKLYLKVNKSINSR